VKTDLCETEAPSFEPGSQFAFLLRVTVENKHQINVAAGARSTSFGASEQIDGTNSKPVWIDRCSDALGNAFAPSPVLGSGANPFSSELTLFPLEIFTKAMRDVVEEFTLFSKKGTFPCFGLCCFVEDFDGANVGAPKRYGGTQTVRRFGEIWQGVAAPEVLDPGRGVFRILPSRWDGFQNRSEYLLRRLVAAGKRSCNSVETTKLLGSLAQRPELVGGIGGSAGFHSEYLRPAGGASSFDEMTRYAQGAANVDGFLRLGRLPSLRMTRGLFRKIDSVIERCKCPIVSERRKDGALRPASALFCQDMRE
jgi:hypothetical protein